MSFAPYPVQITDITRSLPAIVTTQSAHLLSTGQVVRLLVPVDYGMPEVDKKLFVITVLSATTYSLQYSHSPFVDVDSRTFTPFFVPGAVFTPAQSVPVGSAATPISPTNPPFGHGECATLLNDALTNIET